jgi:hypothetical protein
MSSKGYREKNGDKIQSNYFQKKKEKKREGNKGQTHTFKVGLSVKYFCMKPLHCSLSFFGTFAYPTPGKSTK